MIQVQVSKNNNETNASILRRFTRRVQDSGILNVARSHRYTERKPSEYTKKKNALKRITKRKANLRLKKLGLEKKKK